MTQPVLRAVGIAGGAVAAALGIVTVTFFVADGWTLADAFESYALSNLVNGASLAICGTLLALARPRNVLGWLLLAGGLAYLVSAAAVPTSVYAAEHGWPEPLVAVLNGLGVSAWTIAIGLALPFALLTFPTSRLSNAPERVAAVIVGLCGLGFVGLFGGVFAALASAPSDVNPIGAPASNSSRRSGSWWMSQPPSSGSPSSLAWSSSTSADPAPARCDLRRAPGRLGFGS